MTENKDNKSESRRRCVWGIYAILDARAAGRPHLEAARALLEGGAAVIQLRDKTSTFEELMDIGRGLRRMTRDHGADFIVNDNPYLARELDADGVHLGQSDFPADIAREILGPEKIIGLSTHTKPQALAAQLLPVDYIGVGPVYPTRTKVSEWPPVGTALIRWVRHAISLPMVAIGGITGERIVDVVAAGAHNVAMIRELLTAGDIADQTRRLRAVFERAASE
ncbi:MAG: thiamine phosphate synthase [bacterium]|nr:thiamine phosphate synthase [Candidatus Sumerlaeota bacterium]